MELKINSPVGGIPAIYYWPLNKRKGYDEAKEIIETIIWGAKDIPDLEVALKTNILKNVDKTSFESMKNVVVRYNKAINNVLALEKGTQKFCDRLNQIASEDLLHHIIQQTYSNAVTNAEELNKYVAFSSEVYGETSYDLVAQMIEQIQLTKDDHFLDLGSGVGQVILQVAATSLCKSCIGVERAEVPAKYAKAMEIKFKFWMQWYGKKYAPFQLIKGDFFDDIHREKLTDATVIFVNNFAFGPSVDHKLKLRFAELRQGTKIVASKSFCSLNFRLSDRNLSDIGAIMKIQEIVPKTSSVSWTDKPVSFYFHEIDRTKLETYFNSKKNGVLTNFNVEYNEKSSDSVSSLSSCVTPPPKKRIRKEKRSRKEVQNQRLNAQNIIKPSKLILNKPLVEIRENKVETKLNPSSSSSSSTSSLSFPSGGLDSSKFMGFGPVYSSPLEQYMNLKLECFIGNLKAQYRQFMVDMASPSYKTLIRQQIDDELVKNVYLKMRVNNINQEIDKIVIGMETHLMELKYKC